MAYVGYDPAIRASAARAASRPARLKLAWGRLIAVAASLVAWIGIAAAVRAIF